MRLSPLVAAIFVPVVTAVAQQSVFTFPGPSVGANNGTAVASAGDVNDDGYVDVITGAPTSGAGSAEVRSGFDGSVLFTLSGDSVGDRFGAAVCGTGDVNGDGRDDVAVGAPDDDNNGADSGMVRVYSGADGSVLYTFDGDGAGDALGHSVAAAGDVDGDGYDDLIAGAPRDDNAGNNSGMARVYSGRDGSVLHTFDGDSPFDVFGGAVGAAGDINGDGNSDLIVGAAGDDNNGMSSGSVRVLSGADGATLFTFDGDAGGDSLGESVAGAGDVDGDGTPDVVAGAPGEDTNAGDAGAARVFSGADGSILFTVRGTAMGAVLGRSVAGGDIDGDGYSDVLVGSPGDGEAGSAAGAALAFSGPAGCPLYRINGGGIGDQAGVAVALADTNRDGLAEACLGSPGADPGLPDVGTTGIWTFAPWGRLTELLRHHPGADGANFGHRVRAVGDVNQDQVPDYAIGAIYDAGRLGVVRVYSGSDHSVIHTFTGTYGVDSWYGHQIGSLGDLNGDMVGEIAIGAWHADTNAQDDGVVEIRSGLDGAILTTIVGSGFRSHMGSAIANIGDITGDLVSDFILGQGLDNGQVGTVWTFSGATLLRLPALTFTGAQAGEWFGWVGDAVGDINGDQVEDFIIGAPSGQVMPTPGTGYAKVLSGANGQVLFTFNGVATQDLFGYDVSGLGDVNRDGVPDMIVGAYRADAGGLEDSGMARVFSGADGSILHEISGTTPRANLGLNVGRTGDVNGDGHADFFIGAPAASLNGLPLVGSGVVYSGCDGSVLAQVNGTNLLDEMGSSGAGIGDINGDGLPEVVICAKSADVNGQDDGLAVVLEGAFRTDAPVSWDYGSACPGANGWLPRIGRSGNPVLGSSYQTTLRAGPPSASAFWLLDVTQVSFALDPIGMPGCTDLVSPLVVLPVAVDAAGSASYSLPIVVNLSVIGAQLNTQWVIVDPGANSLGLITSAGLAVQIGAY